MNQKRSLPLQNKIMTNLEHYQYLEIKRYEVIHKRSPDMNGKQVWKNVIPATLLPQLLKWYHLVLGQCGQQQLYNTVCARFHASNLGKACIRTVDRCPNKCHTNKQSNKNYGYLPPRVVRLCPSETVAAVDLIGPWKIKVNNIDLKFHAVMCNDPVSNVVDAIRIQNKTSEHVAGEQFKNCWLA